jgi:hypothetical protein
MGHCLHSVQLSNLVQGVNRGGQPTMQAEQLRLHHRH